MSAHSTPQKDHGASTPRAGVCTSYPPLRRSQGLQTSRVAALGRRAVQLKPTACGRFTESLQTAFARMQKCVCACVGVCVYV